MNKLSFISASDPYLLAQKIKARAQSLSQGSSYFFCPPKDIGQFLLFDGLAIIHIENAHTLAKKDLKNLENNTCILSTTQAVPKLLMDALRQLDAYFDIELANEKPWEKTDRLTKALQEKAPLQLTFSQAKLIVEQSGGSFAAAVCEAQKCAAFCFPQPTISDSDLTALLYTSVESSAFHLRDAILKRDISTTLKLCKELQDRSDTSLFHFLRTQMTNGILHLMTPEKSKLPPSLHKRFTELLSAYSMSSLIRARRILHTVDERKKRITKTHVDIILTRLCRC